MMINVIKNVTWHLSIHIRLMLILSIFTISISKVVQANDVDLASIVKGGRLYDNWITELREQTPDSLHPLWPSNNKDNTTIEESWRCVSCHGWQFEKSISHQTRTSITTEQLKKKLYEKDHGFREWLDTQAIQNITHFINLGIVKRIDIDSSNPELAKPYYESICANCHGQYGQTINTIKPLGESALQQPAKVLHKIINGHPNGTMPALRVFGIPLSINMCAYLQQLPERSLLVSIIRGGRLYDNWFKEKKIHFNTFHIATAKFNRKHPAYPKSAHYVDRPRIHWRCKECHGWDYKGNKGAYKKGKHATGIKGILGAKHLNNNQINQLLSDVNHHYDTILNERDRRDIANFIRFGLVDMNEYIDGETARIKTNSIHQEDIYQTICANCHGKDGKRITTMPHLGTLARSNPWEALHKILNGHPDESMPALRILDQKIIKTILYNIQGL